MAQAQNIATVPAKRSLIVEMAEVYGLEPKIFEATVRNTVLPKEATNEQFVQFLSVARQYGLNPFLKEITAIVRPQSRGGGIVPIVPIDGWIHIINDNPAFDGLETDDHLDDKGKLTAVTARIWRKDRQRPTVVTEYMVECARDTDTWKQWPRRMLRHKATIQCARYAFGLGGIHDPDEAERMQHDVSPMRTVDGPPTPPDRDVQRVESGRDDGRQVILGDTEEIPVEPFNEARWLQLLRADLAECKDFAAMGEVQTESMMPAKGIASAEGWRKAQLLIDDTLERLSHVIDPDRDPEP